jgi:hypothetical protein
MMVSAGQLVRPEHPLLAMYVFDSADDLAGYLWREERMDCSPCVFVWLFQES